MIIRFLVDILQLYALVLFVRLILTWFPINPWSKMAKVVRVLAQVTDPVLVPVRRMIPPMRIGGTALDLSPIIIFVAIEILTNVLVSR